MTRIRRCFVCMCRFATLIAYRTFTYDIIVHANNNALSTPIVYACCFKSCADQQFYYFFGSEPFLFHFFHFFLLARVIPRV